MGDYFLWSLVYMLYIWLAALHPMANLLLWKLKSKIKSFLSKEMHYTCPEFLQWCFAPCVLMFLNSSVLKTLFHWLYFFVLIWQSQSNSLTLIKFLYYLKSDFWKMVLGEYRNQEVISQDYYYPEVLLRFSFLFLYLWFKFNRWKETIWNVRNQNMSLELAEFRSTIIYLQSQRALQWFDF